MASERLLRGGEAGSYTFYLTLLQIIPDPGKLFGERPVRGLSDQDQ